MVLVPQFRYSDEPEELRPVTAPYPPPPPAPRAPVDLLANEQAIERLAGRSTKRRKGEQEGLDQIVDVNYEDIKPDEREWLTKALTEEDSDKPGPRNTIKGEKRRKNQITYLAAHAKEREHELKKEWATSAHNKRTSGAKYGFF